ncbi:hypothetical protein JNW90_10515 [Micromonospora sp. STR1s_5]|nr:hypothetical protein [Micromonospora sp. STR1s_5]
MWLAGLAAGAAGDQLWPIVVAGLLAVASAGLTAYAGSRGAWRTADVQRETAFDKRQDERNAHLEVRNVELEAKAARYQELYVRLRVAVIMRGYNPDELLGEAGTSDGREWGQGARPAD